MFFKDRVITPVEDAAGGEADKPARGGQRLVVKGS